MLLSYVIHWVFEKYSQIICFNPNCTGAGGGGGGASEAALSIAPLHDFFFEVLRIF